MQITGLPDWSFVSQISEIWPRFQLVGNKILIVFWPLFSSEVGWP